MLAVPPLPRALYPTWGVWSKVSHMRARYDGGFGPLSITDVEAYLALTNTPMAAWQWDALLLIDGCWLASFEDRRTYPFDDDPEAELEP